MPSLQHGKASPRDAPSTARTTATPRTARSGYTETPRSQASAGGRPKTPSTVEVSPAVKHLCRSKSGSQVASQPGRAAGLLSHQVVDIQQRMPAMRTNKDGAGPGSKHKVHMLNSDNVIGSMREPTGATPRSHSAAATSARSPRPLAGSGCMLDFAAHLYTPESVRCKKQQLSKVTDTLSRTQGGMAIHPKESDPPPSHRVYGSAGKYLDQHGEEAVKAVLHSRKKKALFSEGVSRETAIRTERQHATHFQPPRRRPKSPDFNGSAGLISSVIESHHSGPNLKKQVADAANNDSSNMLRALDDRLVDRSLREERALRERHEKPFRDLCKQTEENIKAMSLTGKAIKASNGMNDSSAVAGLMAFPG